MQFIKGMENRFKMYAHYLRSLGASQIEKSTLDAKNLDLHRSVRIKSYRYSSNTGNRKLAMQENRSCGITDPDCEVCQ